MWLILFSDCRVQNWSDFLKTEIEYFGDRSPDNYLQKITVSIAECGPALGRGPGSDHMHQGPPSRSPHRHWG
jgi:hypothetical protein